MLFPKLRFTQIMKEIWSRPYQWLSEWKHCWSDSPDDNHGKAHGGHVQSLEEVRERLALSAHPRDDGAKTDGEHNEAQHVHTFWFCYGRHVTRHRHV